MAWCNQSAQLHWNRWRGWPNYLPADWLLGAAIETKRSPAGTRHQVLIPSSQSWTASSAAFTRYVSQRPLQQGLACHRYSNNSRFWKYLGEIRLSTPKGAAMIPNIFLLLAVTKSTLLSNSILSPGMVHKPYRAAGSVHHKCQGMGFSRNRPCKILMLL